MSVRCAKEYMRLVEAQRGALHRLILTTESPVKGPASADAIALLLMVGGEATLCQRNWWVAGGSKHFRNTENILPPPSIAPPPIGYKYAN